MVSVIIPTRNRIDILKRTLSSYYNQELVNEIIIVDDDSDEDYEDKLKVIFNQYPKVKSILIKHDKREGAAKSRIDGVQNSTNEFIVFGEDDAFFEKDYITNLYSIYILQSNIGVIAGQIVYMRPGESISDARIRFGNGIVKGQNFNYELLKFNPFSEINALSEIPFVHALFLTTKTLLKKYSFDDFYCNGNGYREETDFQINIHLNGYANYITNKVKCYHLSNLDVQAGGQRSNRFKKFYWTIFYNNYFLNKYYLKYKEKHELKNNIIKAKKIFILDQFNSLFISPILRKTFQIWK